MREFTKEQIATYNNLLNMIGTEIQTKLRNSEYEDGKLHYRGTVTKLALRIIDDHKGVLMGHIYKDKVLKKTISYSMSLKANRAPNLFIAQLVEEIN